MPPTARSRSASCTRSTRRIEGPGRTTRRIGRLILVIHVIHRQESRDSAWRDSGFRVSVELRDEERTSFGKKARKRDHRGPRSAIFGSQATGAMEGPSRKKCEAQADPNFFEGPRDRRLRPEEPRTGNHQVRLTGARREPTEVARPRPEPRTPEELAPEAFDPPRKDAKPSPARQFGPGTSGGRWQHRLPFCIWGMRNSLSSPVTRSVMGRGTA